MSKFIDLTGQRFGRLVVIEVHHKQKMRNGISVFWLCQCDCGQTKVTNSSRLNSESTKSCGCLQKEFAKKLGKETSKNRLKFGEASFNNVYRQYKRNAKIRNIDFKIEKDIFKKLTKENCFYCNSHPYQIHKAVNRQYGEYIYNGIDRVDSSKGYIEGNVVPCCGVCNIAKKSMSKEEFLSWIEQVYNHSIKNKNVIKGK